MKWLFPLLRSLLLTAPGPALAEDSSSCPAGQLQPISSEPSSDTARPNTDESLPRARRATVTDPTPADSVSPPPKAEARVQDRIRTDGLHMVHVWASWCSNSVNELKNGWSQLVADNPNVTLTFETVWNDDERGTEVLDNYDLPDRVVEVTQPDLGPSDDLSNCRRSFLSLSVTWIPSTWIFHKNGELVFALNYGEMNMSTSHSSTPRRQTGNSPLVVPHDLPSVFTYPNTSFFPLG